MGDWLSTVSYWHLTKCREQNEFTPLFLNHQQAHAGLLPWPPLILTAITRSPISWKSEGEGGWKIYCHFYFQWAPVSTSFTFRLLGVPGIRRAGWDTGEGTSMHLSNFGSFARGTSICYCFHQLDNGIWKQVRFNKQINLHKGGWFT